MGLAFPKPNSTRDQHTRVQQQREHWLAVRKAVLARDAHRCRCCGTRHQLDVHHLIARSLGGADSEKNCAALCRSCHRDRHAYRLVIHGTDANKRLRFERT